MSIDQLITNKALARRIGVTTRTIFRWGDDDALQFPAPCVINNRRYYSIDQVEAWFAARRAGGAAPTPRGPTSPAIVSVKPRAAAFVIDRDATELEAG